MKKTATKEHLLNRMKYLKCMYEYNVKKISELTRANSHHLQLMGQTKPNITAAIYKSVERKLSAFNEYLKVMEIYYKEPEHEQPILKNSK